MFVFNPFALTAQFLPPVVMQIYLVLMIVAVAVGTLLDTYHKGSATYFARRRQRANALAQRRLGSIAVTSLAVRTIGEAATSGELGKSQRRLAHLVIMYGFFLYLITTFVMVFALPTSKATMGIVPALWDIGALMVVGSGVWFFFYLRVNVAYDGDPPFHFGRADLFIGSLIVSAALALLWHLVQTISATSIVSIVLFVLYVSFTTLLFGSVFWSKFAHMFYKPVVAFQRHLEEASGASDLPSPARGRSQRS
jgi:hypothetical protein